MKIYDTQSRTEVVIDTSSSINMYVCGLTVYDDAHVGHARSAIVFDVLRRHLELGGTSVKFVQNITDVDDKILDRASEMGIEPATLAVIHIARSAEDYDALNIKKPTHSPKATEHIEEMIKMIQTLIEKKAAYVTEKGVYFDVTGFTDYGKLSGKKTNDLISGIRIKLDKMKHNPLDFALWKNSDTTLSWQSPWGKGRPGWHIECSAMSKKYLDDKIDIHGGGRDLIFPHHENEIAQSETCFGSRYAKVWMHTGMVTVGGQKMSKSEGNSKILRAAIEQWGPNVLRVFYLGANYAKPIDYSEKALNECATRWQQAETCHYELAHLNAIQNNYKEHSLWIKCKNALDDNCNTRGAQDALFELAGIVNDAAASNSLTSDNANNARGVFDAMINVLGFKIIQASKETKTKLESLATRRETLRSESKYDEADVVRDEMIKLGADVLDHGTHSVWIIRE